MASKIRVPFQLREDSMLSISVNGQKAEIEREMSIAEMLTVVEVPPNYLAVEINGEVVPREEHNDHVVKAGDEVEVVTLVGGG